MKPRTFLRRTWWIFLIIPLAGLAWWWALGYLGDFRAPDVPFVTTPKDVVEKMLDLAEVTDNDTVYDLGSGDGRILIAAAGRGARAVGIEIDPHLVQKSRQIVRDAELTRLVSVRRGDIFKQNLTPATVITMYLKPLVNVELRPQLDRLRPGTRIVSHMFSMPGAKPAKKSVVKSAETGLDHTVYLWVTPIEWEE